MGVNQREKRKELNTETADTAKEKRETKKNDFHREYPKRATEGTEKSKEPGIFRAAKPRVQG